MKLNKFETHLIDFLMKYPNQWHGYLTDKLTLKTVKSVAEKFPNIELSESTEQMRYNEAQKSS